jgi:hypothetical protein
MDPEQSYWKDRRLHSLVLAVLLALPLAIGVWLVYHIIHETGYVVYQVLAVLVSTGNAPSVTIVDYSDCFNVGMSICPTLTAMDGRSLEPVIGSIVLTVLLFSAFAWLLEKRTKRKIFWWYPVLIISYEIIQYVLCGGYNLVNPLAICYSYLLALGGLIELSVLILTVVVLLKLLKKE